MNSFLKYISYIIILLISSFYLSFDLSGQYEGGNNAGFSYSGLKETCIQTSIYNGSQGDGFFYTDDFQTCYSRLFSVGGNGNGFSVDTNTYHCIIPNIFSGDISDGFAQIIGSPCSLDSIVIETEIIEQHSCITLTPGIAAVHITDGYPYWQSLPDYTYIWKNESGDTLSGYPLVKSSLSDTIHDLNAGLYTVIVYDSNMKADSAQIYINECLYRGGDGNGFVYDNLNQDCNLSSIYENSGKDGFDADVDILSCDFYLFSGGGNGSGFSVDTTTYDCTPPEIYSGNTNDGYNALHEMLICESRLFSTGGNGNGFSVDTVTEDCIPLNIFNGTPGDGFGYDSLVSLCYSTLFSLGGEGSGYSHDSSTQNCMPVSIFTNSGNDGFDSGSDILNCESVLFTHGGSGNGFSIDTSLQDCTVPNIFSGNTGDGFSLIHEIPCLKDSIVIFADVIDQISCPVTSDDGSAYVSVLDGFPDWRSIPSYTYIWKRSNGDTLAGYPKLTTEISDTITNLGVDEYTVIVSDLTGNIDSAIIYINECLFRGGAGAGFSNDSLHRNCPVESVYTASDNDGFDHAVDIALCPNTIFTMGGNGNGYSSDSLSQNCPVISIYENSGNDGFDSGSEIMNCDVKYFSIGGDGDGFTVDTTTRSCDIPLITSGEHGDGTDQIYSGCTPYIYDYPSTNNTCLDADTIVSDGSDNWQIILKNDQVVASVKDNGNILGEITTQFYINDNPVRIDPFGILPSYYLDRNFKISVENLVTGPPVRVRLYFLSNELQSLISEDINVSSINDLGVTKYTGRNENCQLFDNVDHNDSLNYSHNTNIDWNIYENGYYLEFDVTSFSEFYINNSTSLPEPYEITANLSVTSDYNGEDISCYGASDGEATVTPTYGIAPFTYEWDDPYSQTDSIASGLAAGMYHVTVTDNNHVIYTDSITLTQPDSIHTEYTTTNTCENKNEGTINLNVTGGTIITDYTYTWSTFDGSGLIVDAEDQLYLSGGKYYVTVEDANMCSKTDSVTILEYPLSVAPTGIDVTNNNTCPADIKTLTPVGGSLGYNAVWRWYSEAACNNLLYTGSPYDVNPAVSTNYWLRAEGDCDTSATASTTVTVLTVSTAADNISKSDDNIAPGTNDTLIIHGGALGDGASWNWYLDETGTIPAGPDGDTLIVSPLVTTTYWARAEGTCNNTVMVNTTVTINPLPLQPATPTGPDTLCINSPDTDYQTTGATGATSYVWSINPPEAGTITGTGLTGTVEWATDWHGDVEITVAGENISGTGPASDPMEVFILRQVETGRIYHVGN